MDQKIRDAKRWVIKIGSALLTNDGQGLDHENLRNWADQIARLRKDGKEVVLVSSGAVAAGMSRLGWKTRPSAIHNQQAAAAIGQMGLIQAYESSFQRHGLQSAQVLLTHDDLSDRKRFINARSTLKTLLALGTIPVVNENDTVATSEIRFGDNDTLAAMVANIVDADVLLILTDQTGLYDRNPQLDSDAVFIGEDHASNPKLLDYAGGAASELSRGGMRTKILAARKAEQSGTHTIIASGRESEVILRLAAGEHLGTRLLAKEQPLAARKQWIANVLQPRGKLWLDQGASDALLKRGRSLLPVGITKVEGEFQRGEAVDCLNTDGAAVARGLTNYSAEETRRIAGYPSQQIEELLGYVDEPEVIHRDNLSLTSNQS